ncbi:uncharacterized protein LOC143590618 [Bidens hawaiensis]|uniref:uncharacterized protein LOC143590618 n=1 Tax=Bidens hawaiensis TaxID=980011 RepID=UPI00404B3B3A
MAAAVWLGGPDQWKWLGDSSGEFSVSSVKKLLVKSRDSNVNFVLNWCKWVPAKCLVHAWRAGMNRDPTKEALERRNILISNRSCLLCDSGEETIDLITSSCYIATMVWESIKRWCKVHSNFGLSARDLLEWYNSVGLGNREKEAFHGIVVIACWRLWKARNDKKFEGKEVKIEEIIGDIKSLGFLWYKHRSKYKTIGWSNWCKFSFM